MIWLLDLGNTRAKAGSWHQGQLVRLQAGCWGPEGPAAVLDRLAPAEQPTAIWVSSVAGSQVQAAVIDWARGRDWPSPRFARSTAEALGVRCAYADPSRLGVDRWMVVLAAAATGRDALIVDAGTACTVDAVTADGRHLGGLILPGVALARSALNQRTQFLAEDVVTTPLPVVGNDTNPAVTVGAVHALLGAIARVQAGLAQSSDWHDPLCVLTGGEARLLAPHLPGGWLERPHYVLEGLARLAVAADETGDIG